MIIASMTQWNTIGVTIMIPARLAAIARVTIPFPSPSRPDPPGIFFRLPLSDILIILMLRLSHLANAVVLMTAPS